MSRDSISDDSGSDNEHRLGDRPYSRFDSSFDNNAKEHGIKILSPQEVDALYIEQDLKNFRSSRSPTKTDSKPPLKPLEYDRSLATDVVEQQEQSSTYYANRSLLESKVQVPRRVARSRSRSIDRTSSKHHHDSYGKFRYAEQRHAIQPGTPYFRSEFVHQYGTYQHQSSGHSSSVAVGVDLDVAAFVKAELDGNTQSLWELVTLVGYGHEFQAMTVNEFIDDVWPQAKSGVHAIFARLADGNLKPIDQATTKTGEDDASKPKSKPVIKILSEKERAISQESRDIAKLRPNAVSDIGDSAISSIDALLAREADWTFKDPESKGLSVSLSWNREREGKYEFLLMLSGRTETQMDIIEALAWLLSILRCSNREDSLPFETEVYMRASRKRDRLFFLRPHDYEPIQPGADCWTKLLSRTPSAANFCTEPRPPRCFGLEVTFELMCFLAGLRYEIVIDGGVILCGDNGMVYPLFQHGDCVQWHFVEVSHDTNFGKVLKDSHRMQCDDLERLRHQPRHFVGLWEKAQVTLGTSACDYTSLKFSRASMVKKLLISEGHTVGGSIAAPKVLTLSYSRYYKIAKTRETIFTANFLASLQSKITTPVLLYSPAEKRAWMVSYVSLVLHLARSRIQHQQGLGFYIPACELEGNGGLAAFNCIKACYRHPLKRPEPNEVLSEAEKKWTVEDYITDIVASLHCAQRETTVARRILHNKILGFELADIARLKESLVLKEHALDLLTTGWAPLLSEINYVFFYEGLSDPIVPSPAQLQEYNQRTCGTSIWQRIPQGHNLLASSMPCLMNLSERWTEEDESICEIVPGFYWNRPKGTKVFELCSRTNSHTCFRLQELASSRTDINPPRIKHNEALNSAVAFRYGDSMKDIQRQLALAPPPTSKTTSSTGHERADSGYSSRSRQMQNLSLDSEIQAIDESEEALASSGSTDSEILHDPACQCRVCRVKSQTLARKTTRTSRGSHSDDVDTSEQEHSADTRPRRREQPRESSRKVKTDSTSTEQKTHRRRKSSKSTSSSRPNQRRSSESGGLFWFGSRPKR